MAKKTNIYIPYKRYIQVLILGRLTPQQLADDLNINELVVPTPYIITKIRDELYLEDKDFFDDPNYDNEPTEQLLDTLQIKEGYAFKFADIYGPTYGFEGAVKMHQDQHLRRALEALALGKVTPEDIELLTNGKYDITYNTEDFKCFFHYFYDVYEWGLQEKKDYLSKLTGYDNDTIRIFKEALKGDKPTLLWQLGFSPGLSIEQMARSMMEAAHFKYFENIKNNTDDATKWSTVFEKMAARCEKIETESEQKANMYEEMVFKIKKTDVMVDIQDAKDLSTDLPTFEGLKSRDLDTLPGDDSIIDAEDLADLDSAYEQ